MLINFDKSLSFFSKGIIVNQGSKKEFIIECDDFTLGIAKGICAKYYTENVEKIKEDIRHNWSSYQIDSKKSSLGKYYTPLHLIELVKKHATPFLENNKDTYVLDSCAGCGSFLEAFEEYKIIGRDVDKEAVEILRELGYKNIATDNSLVNSNREKYNLSDDDVLLIVGNPPYNDTSSKNKRFGTNKKLKDNVECDIEIKGKDYGISFLKHYAMLNPQEIVVLHPLSYLIKQTNFKSLGFFTSQYKLLNATVLSSKEFGNAIDKNRTPFPIVCARYLKGSMQHKTIKDFKFDILNSNNKFSLHNVYTIDDYGVRKYPTKGLLSDIGLYHYNIRDTNSLMTSGNICENFDKNCITVMFDKLYQYCYLQTYRQYFPKQTSLNYLAGNLSPLCNKEDLDNKTFQDICIMNTIFAHKNRVEAFDKNNERSFIYTKFLVNGFRQNKNSHKLYESFLNYLDKDYDCAEDFEGFFKPYFLNLLKVQLGFDL